MKYVLNYKIFTCGLKFLRGIIYDPKPWRRIIFFIFLTTSIFAQKDLQINLELADIENALDAKTRKNIFQVSLGVPFKLKVIVEGSGSGSSDEIKISGIENLNIQGKSQAMAVSGYNGKYTTKTTYIYDVMANKLGAFSVGPAIIEKNGKTYKSNPDKIKYVVVKPKGGSVVRGNQSSNFKNIGSTSADAEYELFCRLEADKKEAVIGEPILLSVKIYGRGNIAQIGLEPLKFTDFLSKEIEKVTRYDEKIDGKLYEVLVKKYLLIPTKTGDIEIPSIPVSFGVKPKAQRIGGGFFDEDFFSGLLGNRVIAKQAFSDSLKINISSLPAYSGSIDGVGQFNNFDMTVDKNEAFVNEAILLKLQVSGKGNLDQVVTPDLDLPDSFNIYESKTDLKEDLTTSFDGGQKTFEFVLQVSQPGDWQIPEQKFTYFDTKEKKYKILKTNPIDLKIKIPVGQQATAFNKPNISLPQELNIENNFEKDIHFIQEDVFNVIKRKDKGISLGLLIFLLFLPVVLFYKKIILLLPGISYIKKVFSGKFSKKKLLSKFKYELDGIIKNGEEQKIYNFFLKYFATLFNIDVSLVNEDFIQEKLKERGWEDKRINEFLSYLSLCASLSFAANSVTNIEQKKLLEKSRYWFLILDSNK